MTLTSPLSLLAVLMFVLVHILGGRLSFLPGLPRSIWLSGAGGISVAYVFVHLLPELARHQENLTVRARDAQFLGSLESRAYIIALAGLVLFYGVERLARSPEPWPSCPLAFCPHA